MRIYKVFFIVALIIVVSTICSSGEAIAESMDNSTGLDKYEDLTADTPIEKEIPGDSSEKTALQSHYNCDPKMLIQGDPEIDPRMLIPRNSDIDSNILIHKNSNINHENLIPKSTEDPEIFELPDAAKLPSNQTTKRP